MHIYNNDSPDKIKVINSSMLVAPKMDQLLREVYKDENETRRELLPEQFKTLFRSQINQGQPLFEDYERDIKRWIESDNPCLVKFPGTVLYQRMLDTKGIATKFASLKTDKEIENFAKEYGLLGVLSGEKNFSIDYAITLFEPLSLWKNHIKNIRRLLKLYRALAAIKERTSLDIVGEIVTVKEENDFFMTFEWVPEDKNDNDLYIPFLFDHKVIKEKDFDNAIGVNLLTQYIQTGLKNTINIVASEIVPSMGSIIGYRIKEERSTDYLLAAIYYDLWKLISNDEVIHLCGYCGRPFKKSGRKKYCNDSCKTMAYQNRMKGDK
jgi:hypothetical protein